MSYLTGFLAYGHVDAKQVTILLVDYRVQAQRGLASCTVSYDELALASPHRDHGVYGFHARLDREVDLLTGGYAWCYHLYLRFLGGLDGTFAVDRVAQGEGIGRDLWYAVCRDQAAFYWRARDSNRISSWYTTMCDGMVRADGWFVYWRGVQRRDIPAIVEQALKWPDDFDAPEEDGSGGAG